MKFGNWKRLKEFAQKVAQVASKGARIGGKIIKFARPALDAAADFIHSSLISTFQEILDSGSWMDAKSHFQEVAQSHESATPVYKVLAEEGPDHDKIFTVGVFVNGQLKGQGTGPSKQIGQQKAAETALEAYQDSDGNAV